MAKIHCHSLLSGSSWSSFDEDSSDEEPEAMEVDENNTFGLSEATRLRNEDMNLYGLCPAQEEVCLVICKECGRVVKASTFSRHCALLHKKVIPPPTPSPETIDDSPTVDLLLQSSAKTSTNNTAIKIEKLEPEDCTVKIEEVPLTVPKLNHTLSAPTRKLHSVHSAAMKKSASTNRKSPRKVIPTREREFDADKHCGVWVQEQQKRCTRSLTCKTHALSLRRAVPGRRKKFDELLAEHKARVNCEKEQQQQNLAALKLLESKAAVDKNNLIKGNGLITETTSKSTMAKHLHTVRSNSIEVLDESSEVTQKGGERESEEDGLSYSELTTLNHHPQPLATCSFGGRKVGHGSLIFNRRQDHLRCAMLAMVEKCLNPSQQRHTTGRPGAAAILHRPAVKTVAQSSNHGLYKGTEKHKSGTASNRNLSNFLKAPPPPRNRSTKHNNVIHGNHSHKHSVDSFQTSNTLHSKTFIDSSTSNLVSTVTEGSGFLKPDASSQAISDMGNIIASIDANVSGGQPLSIGQTLGNNLRTQSGIFPSNVNVSLDSTLNLCSSIGLNTDVSGTRTGFTTIYTTINNNSAVNAVQTTAGNVKEILPAPLAAKINGTAGVTCSSSNTMVQLAGQLDPITGIVTTSSTGQRESPLFFTTQNSGTVQVASSLPNGAGPSPPPIVTSVKGYPLSFVIQGSANTKGGAAAVAAVTNQSPVSFTKGHSLVFNNMGMAQMQQQASHLVAHQPSPPLLQTQVQQKGKVLLRANSYPKSSSKSSNSQVKIPQSPSPQQQLSPGQTQLQQKTIIVTSPPPGQQNLYLNHQHISTAPQPIVQLKHQVEQQQQQLQQITLQQQQLQHQQQQQLHQQQLQQHKQVNSQFVKQQLPIQPRLAPAPRPPSQSIITQQQLSGQNIVIKAGDQPLKSPPNSVFVTNESHQNMQATVVHKPQSNVA